MKYTMDDIGNAQRFLDLFNDQAVFVPRWNAWVSWNGKTWKINEALEVMKYAQLVTAEMMGELNGGEIEKGELYDYQTHITRSRNKSGLMNMLALASAVEEHHRTPEDFDSHPLLLTCKNGMLDLESGKLYPFDKSKLLTRMIPVEYNPEAKCPEFDRFIETAMCWDGWDGSTHLEMLAYMFRVMGYAITGLTAERCFFIFHGEGRNGKSVLLSLLEAILGRGVLAGRIKSESLLATGQRSGSSHDTDIADIEGMRVILASEIPDGSVLNEGLVKALTGNEVIKTRQLNQKGRLIKPQGKLFLAVNHLPRIGGQDEGIWDRIHRIPWNVRVVKPDLLLTDRLIKNELAGILNTCVMGFQNYLQEGGLKPPAVVLEANKQYRDDEDIVGRFLADCCQLGEDLECTNTELYGAYNTWAKGSGYRPVAENRLGRMFSERGFTRTHSKSQRGWRGLSVTASVQAGEDAPAWLEPERQLRMIGG